MAFIIATPFFLHHASVTSTSSRLVRTQTVRTQTARAQTTRTRFFCKAREVTADELESVLEANQRPVLVDAFAEWCGPCQYMIPQLDILASKLGHKVDVLKLDTEKFPDLASALMVRGLPTLFFIKDRKLRHRMEGALPAEELEKLVDYVLFDGPPPQNM